MDTSTDTVDAQSHRRSSIVYRPLQPRDYDALKGLHSKLFPIDYDDAFYHKAIHSLDRVFSWAAINMCEGKEELAGVITARTVYVYEMDPVDRHHMGMSSRVLDTEMGIYILTLGVSEAQRHRGIAKQLINLVYQQACNFSQCRFLFLHVITYNQAAICLYDRHSFQCMARLANFYHIQTGRQPDPSQHYWDALLYVLFLPCYNYQPPSMWDPLVNTAVAPFRNALGHFNACLPWFCRSTWQPASPQMMPHPNYQVGGAAETFLGHPSPLPQPQHPNLAYPLAAPAVMPRSRSQHNAQAGGGGFVANMPHQATEPSLLQKLFHQGQGTTGYGIGKASDKNV